LVGYRGDDYNIWSLHRAFGCRLVHRDGDKRRGSYKIGISNCDRNGDSTAGLRGDQSIIDFGRTVRHQAVHCDDFGIDEYGCNVDGNWWLGLFNGSLHGSGNSWNLHRHRY
jgi:hypothetical protein